MQRSFYLIDAFTDRRHGGNAAAVVPDAHGLTDAEMQSIAAEFNQSETTFVLPASVPAASGETALRIRWFTPSVEANMCGHATVAGIHALLEAGQISRNGTDSNGPIRIETKSGLLTAFVESLPSTPDRRMIWLELRPPRLSPMPLDLADLAESLCLPIESFETSLPIERTQDSDLLVFVRNFQAVNVAQPEFGQLRRLLEHNGLRGLLLATLGTLTPSITVQSRFFAPPVGINEDSVTGSVHGPLASYLVRHGRVPVHGKSAGMMCVQGRPGGRTGTVFALVECGPNGEHAVRIGGQAVTTAHGTLVE